MQNYYLETAGVTSTDHLVSQKHTCTSSYQNSSLKCMPWVCHFEHTTTKASSKITSRTSSMMGIVSVGTLPPLCLTVHDVSRIEKVLLKLKRTVKTNLNGKIP